MKQFCSLHPPVRNDTPTQEEEEDVFRHLLYDDNKEIIFCYVPKGSLGIRWRGRGGVGWGGGMDAVQTITCNGKDGFM